MEYSDNYTLSHSQKLRIQLIPEDNRKLKNTICIPFKTIFKGIVKIKAITPDERNGLIYNKKYNIHVVEALLGTWLSRVTEYALGSVDAAYDRSFIALVLPEIAKSLQMHGVVGGGDTPNFPDVYKKGDVPADYDPTEFNPDEIYPGQRFIFITPFEDFSYMPFNVTPPPEWYENIWVGIIGGAQAGIGIGGSHVGYGGVLNLGDMIKHGTIGRSTGICAHGWSLGLGLGASGDAAVIIFVNYPTIESLNFVDAPTEKSWWKKSLDWDLALGIKIPKGAPKLAEQLLTVLKSLKGLKQYDGLKGKGKIIKRLAETIIKNTKGLPGSNGKCVIKIPIHGKGLHAWAGWKTTEYETFWERQTFEKLEDELQ